MPGPARRGPTEQRPDHQAPQPAPALRGNDLQRRQTGPPPAGPSCPRATRPTATTAPPRVTVANPCTGALVNSPTASAGKVPTAVVVGAKPVGAGRAGDLDGSVPTGSVPTGTFAGGEHSGDLRDENVGGVVRGPAPSGQRVIEIHPGRQRHLETRRQRPFGVPPADHIQRFVQRDTGLTQRQHRVGTTGEAAGGPQQPAAVPQLLGRPPTVRGDVFECEVGDVEGVRGPRSLRRRGDAVAGNDVRDRNGDHLTVTAAYGGVRRAVRRFPRPGPGLEDTEDIGGPAGRQQVAHHHPGTDVLGSQGHAQPRGMCRRPPAHPRNDIDARHRGY